MRIGPLGIFEILLILVVVLLIFGPKRLPEMAKGIGQSVREFRKGVKDIRNDIEDDVQGTKGASVSASTAAPATDSAPADNGATKG